MLAALKVFCTTDESGDAQLIPQPPVPLAAFLTFFNEAGKILNSFNIYLFTVSLTPGRTSTYVIFPPNSNIIKQINPAT